MSAGCLALWLLVTMPAAVGALLVTAERRTNAIAAPVSLATAAVAVALAGIVAVTRPAVSAPFVAGAKWELAVDALSALVAPAVAAVTLLVLVFTVGALPSLRARFHGLMLVFAAAAAATATATTLPTLLMAWEIMGATSYALIGFWWRDQSRVVAGATAFLTTRAADLGLYVASAAALAGGAGLALTDLAELDVVWRHVAAAGVLVAALGKAAQLPFSFWLRQAMQGPSPVSALLHSAAMVAMGGYLLLRTAPLLQATGWAAVSAAWIGAVTALVLGAVAVTQRDPKQLLAASTCAQLGFIVLGAGLSAIVASAAHLVAHAATKALLFLITGVWFAETATGRVAARRWSLIRVCAALGALALAGIAPLSLWATKSEIMAVARTSAPALYVIALAATALSAASAARLLFTLWQSAPADASVVGDEAAHGARYAAVLLQAPLVVLTVGATVLGLLVTPPVGDLLRGALGEWLTPTASPGELTSSALLSLLVVMVVRYRRPPEPVWGLSWLGMAKAVDAAVVRPTLKLATALARFDDRVLDRSVMAVARAGRTVGRAAACADVRWVDCAVVAAAHGMYRLGMCVRNLQSGRVHRYYRLVVVVLALCVLLLVLAS